MTNLIDSLDGLDFGPEAKAAAAQLDSPASAEPTEYKLARGGTAARVLYEVARCTRIIVVNAPPGAGKSTCVATVAAHLANRFGLSVTIGSPRREQAVTLALRLLNQVPAERINLRVNGIDPAVIHPDLTRLPTPGKPGMIHLRTLASLAMSGGSGTDDRLLIVDEAHQVEFSQAAAAAAGFGQVVAVGDPGQIGPVVSVDTRPFDHHGKAPHKPFAAVMAGDSEAKVLSMPSTYRLGPDTTDLVNTFYDFGFDSRRPDTWLTDATGRRLDELTAAVSLVADGTDPVQAARGHIGVVADRAAALVGATLHTTGRDGTVVTRPVEAGDVAVTCALNAQVSMAAAMLSARGIDGVTVGTADKLQGGQWPVVVALDPLAGGHVSDHHLSAGRLCVMLSRHTAHLTFVHDARWRDTLDGLDHPDAATHATVRARLCGGTIRTSY